MDPDVLVPWGVGIIKKWLIKEKRKLLEKIFSSPFEIRLCFQFASDCVCSTPLHFTTYGCGVSRKFTNSMKIYRKVANRIMTVYEGEI